VLRLAEKHINSLTPTQSGIHKNMKSKPNVMSRYDSLSTKLRLLRYTPFDKTTSVEGKSVIDDSCSQDRRLTLSTHRPLIE